MPNSTIEKAFKDGLITQKQKSALPEKLLLGIIKKKRGGGGKGTKKGEVRKTARRAYEPKKKSSPCKCPNAKAPKKKGGVKEKRKKIGKEAHKRGRRKGGSKVDIVK